MLDLRRPPHKSRASLLHLPPELLGRILYFAQVVGDRIPSSRAQETRWVRYDTGWAEYTLVCQHVRKIALATPMLWTIVVHTSTNRGSSKWAELCVERSGSCLLTINVLSPVYHHNSLPTYPLPESCWERACRVAVRGAPPLNHLDLPVLAAQHYRTLSSSTITSRTHPHLGCFWTGTRPLSLTSTTAVFAS
jgi:hypothetical protein